MPVASALVKTALEQVNVHDIAQALQTALEQEQVERQRFHEMVDENLKVEQYKLVRGQYELIFKSSEGNIKSFVIKGFEIPIAAIFEKKANLKALKQLMGN